ncbi:MAG: cell division protein ZapA [Mariprofundaceae bacterium]
MTHKIQVTLLGRTFSLHTDDDPNTVHAAAELVQKQLDELRSISSTVSTDRLLALTALNLAADLIKKDAGQIQGLDGILASLDETILQAEGLAKVPLR